MNRFHLCSILRGLASFIAIVGVHCMPVPCSAQGCFERDPLPEKDTAVSEEERLYGIVMTEDIFDYGGWAYTTEGCCVPIGRPASRDSVTPIIGEANTRAFDVQSVSAGKPVKVLWVRISSERLEEPTAEVGGDLCPPCCRWIDARTVARELEIDTARTLEILSEKFSAESVPVTPAEIVHESILDAVIVGIRPDGPWLGLITDNNGNQIEHTVESEVMKTADAIEADIR